MIDTAYAIRTIKAPYRVHATLWGPLAEHAQFALLHFLTTPKIKRLETWDHDTTDNAVGADPS